MSSMGHRLNKLRTENNFSKESLAEFLSMAVVDVTKLEHDEKILTVSQLERLCDLYCVSEEYIIENKCVNTSREKYDMENLDLNTKYKMNKRVRNIELLVSILE